jgi:Tfp pilus assembly protein PilN
MQQIDINLLPEKKKKFDVKLPSIPIFPILMLAVLAAASYYLFMIVPQSWDGKLSDLDQQIDDLRKQKQQKIGQKQQELQALNDKISRLRRVYEDLKKLTGVDKEPWSRVFTVLSQIVPKEVWIKSFNYNKSGSVTMSCMGVPVDKAGEKWEYGAVSKFLEKMETNNSMFYQPFCNQASLTKMRGKTVVNFSMKCKLKKDKANQ